MSDAYRRRLLEFADLVARLRLHQRRYFRKKDNLAACRDYERRVDEQTKEILGTMQPTLFEGFVHEGDDESFGNLKEVSSSYDGPGDDESE